MKFQKAALAVSAALAISGTSHAVEVIGKSLEVYGKLHVSIDSVKADPSVSNTSISSNSSRLGFKGEGELKDGLQGFYQIESKVVVDETGSTLASRNTFVGLKGSFGSVLTGYRDTPFRDIRADFDLFDDTVADARGVLGSDAAGNDKFNVRAQNALMYTTPEAGGFKFNLMYSTAETGTAQQGQDNNDTALTSASLKYQSNSFDFGVGYEKQDDDKSKGLRANAKFKFGDTTLGLIYEKLTNDASNSVVERSAYGANVAYKINGENSLKLQYVVADDYEGSSNSGANFTSIGWDHKLNKDMNVYLVYSNLDNEAGAKYILGGGHDSDKYSGSVNGDDIKALSLGIIYKF